MNKLTGVIMIITGIFVTMMLITWFIVRRIVRTANAYKRLARSKEENYKLLVKKNEQTETVNQLLYTLLLDLVTTEKTDVSHKLANIKLCLKMSMNTPDAEDVCWQYYEAMKSASGAAQDRIYAALMRMLPDDGSISYVNNHTQQVRERLVQRMKEINDAVPHQIRSTRRTYERAKHPCKLFEKLCGPEHDIVIPRPQGYEVEVNSGVTVVRGPRLTQQ